MSMWMFKWRMARNTSAAVSGGTAASGLGIENGVVAAADVDAAEARPTIDICAAWS